MRILDLAIKDLRQILRERQSAFFLLIMPVAFTVLFGFAFGGFSAAGAEEGDPRLPLGLLTEDDGAVAGHLVALLEQSDVLRPEPATGDRAALAERVAAGDLPAALVIPAGYGERLAAGEDVPLTLIVDAAGPTGFTIQGAVEAAVGRLRSALAAARIGADEAAAQGLVAGDEEARRAIFAEMLARAVAAWAAPPVDVRAGSTGASATGEVYGDNAFAHSSPGMMAQFVMAGLITASQVLVLERKSGSMRRLLTTNMTRPGILIGHFLAMFLMIVAQLLVLILFGALLLGLPYFREPGATLLLLLATALFAASMGLLIGVMAHSEEQAVVFSLVPMFLLAGLGGAWMPLEFTPASVQRVAYLTPIAWMMDGFKDILVRGQGLDAVLTAIGVLLAYAAVFWLLAAWRFRRLTG